ncbi:DUF1707 domain-containing protein [Kitasatospora sp. NPDC052896]|uniref:DUF1707 domain-containing protein n=1 Tax=Kitasatospora sp. NPDC052896 TaxID=3364061 RepID=UPI0037C96E05
MSGDLVPGDGGLRASHEDRDRVVERLRVAAGDGRLTAEELEERLDVALNARTYGELEVLLTDLPAEQVAPGQLPVAPAKELVRLQARGGNINRVGPWVVPRRIELEVRGGNARLDFTQAQFAGSTLDLAIALRGGNLHLVVPPEVAVDVDSVSTRGGNVRQLVRRDPQAAPVPIRLLVTLSGEVTGGNVIVRGPRRGFWARLFGR